MAIQVGDRLPDVTFRIMSPEGPTTRSTAEIFSGRNIVLVAVPGAYTPTCHRNHLPGYVRNVSAFKDKGIDAIAVTAVNDVFVMDRWQKDTDADGGIEFLADGNADFAKAIGLDFDASAHGLGTRSKRYAMLVKDGVVESLQVEDVPSKADVSAAESVLKAL